MNKLVVSLIILALVFFSGLSGFIGAQLVNNYTCERTFFDQGLGISISYSCEWDVINRTEVSRANVFNEEVGLTLPTLNAFEIDFVNNDTTVRISPLLISTSGLINGFVDDSSFVRVNENLIRFENNNQWSYGHLIDCSSIPAARINLEDPEFCASTLFSELSTERQVLLSVGLTGDFSKADKLVKSFFEN
ncbi:MAG: hypothetical protein Kow0081_3060 [Candidatus Dojkabacteria bacterium]